VHRLTRTALAIALASVLTVASGVTLASWLRGPAATTSATTSPTPSAADAPGTDSSRANAPGADMSPPDQAPFWSALQQSGIAARPAAAAPLDALDSLPVTGATYTVNSTNDVDDTVCDVIHCSLREAINASNATLGGRDLIDFEIPAALTTPYIGATDRHEILLTAALPMITQPVFIDGATDADFMGQPVIALVGGGLSGAGLHVAANSGSAVEQLMVYDFDGDGIVVDSFGGNVIQYNFIGTDVDGATTLANTGDGIQVTGVTTNTLGGNVLSGNDGAGLRLIGAGATDNQIKNNFIGSTLENGKRPGNGDSGIVLDGAPANIVEANIIGGNGAHGIAVLGAGGGGNQIRSNTIGSTVPDAFDVSFGADLPNALDGVHIDGAPDNLLVGNTITRNLGDGVEITGATATGNALYGNGIGADEILWPGGDLGNGGHGVWISAGAGGTCVGGDDGDALCPGSLLVPDSRNRIAFNGLNGVTVGNAPADTSTGNPIRFNTIYSNDGLGIDLGDDGPTPNDAGDGDSGPNNLQNSPEILRLDVRCAITGSAQVVVRLDSAPGLYTLDIYANAPDTFSAPDTPEAQELIRTTTIAANTIVQIPLPPGSVADLTITATDAAGNTSELAVISSGTTFTVNDDGDGTTPGYVANDGAAFDFVDISGTGTDLTLGDDAVSAMVPVGFSFSHFGTPYTNVWISSNGWLSFSNPGGDSDPTNNCPLPTILTPNNLIAAIWDDLDASVAGAAVYQQTFAAGTCPYGTYAGACFVAQWNDVVHKGSSDDLTFEVVLFDNDELLVQILDAGDELGSGSTTGIENAGGTQGALYACDTPVSLVDNLAIRFSPADLGDANPGDGVCETMTGNGVCTLRAAIDETNALSGVDRIHFDIGGGGAATISPSLPYTVTDPVIIDGTTQPDAGPIDGRIILDGSYTVDDAIRIFGGNSIVRQIEIIRYTDDGIELLENGCNLIRRCRIGTDPLNSAAIGMGGNGVRIYNTISNTLDNNIIAANDGWGVVITGSLALSNTLLRNFVGVTGSWPFSTTLVALGNASGGVLIYDAPNNFVGSSKSVSSEANVISSNGNSGVTITGTLATGNRVLNNYIGLDLTGEEDLGNTDDGVRIVNAPLNTVDGNYISANGDRGVAITGAPATGNLVTGNTIGLNALGTIGIGNGESGVFIQDASASRLVGNHISGNDAHGVEIIGTLVMTTEISGNTIGTDRAGLDDIANDGSGIRLTGASVSSIQGNHISGNGGIFGPDGYGIHISGSTAMSNTMIGNFIGVDVAGSFAIPNIRSGILIDGAPNNTIGAASPLPSNVNVISGNGHPLIPAEGNGIELRGAGATGNVVQGNVIGANFENLGSTVDTPIPNQRHGVYVNGAPGNTIGGLPDYTDNTIAGNTLDGVHITGAGASFNKVQGNTIGSNRSATATNLGNGRDGIRVDGASDTCIGAEPGFTPCPAPPGESGFNRIAYNDDNGINILSGLRNAMVGNEIYLNDLLGIDLGNNGVTANDGGDGDGGANNLQNFPVLTLVQSLGPPHTPQTMVTGSLDSAGGPFRIEFFRNTACDPSNFGEGAVFIGAEDGVAAGAFMITLNLQVPVGEFLTATATDASGNTSEFSMCRVVEEKPTPTPTLTPTDTPSPTATQTSTPQPTLTPSNTPTAIPPDPTIIFFPIDDSRVQSGNPTGNYGSSTYMRIRGGTTAYRSFLKFDVAGLWGPIYRVRLRLYAYDGSNSAGSVYAVANSWSESTVNWNNAPTIGGSPLATLGAVADNSWVEYDVTSAVNGEGVFSFGLLSSSTNTMYFYSEEATNFRPELHVDFFGPSATPSPGPSPTATPTSGPSPTSVPSPTATRTPTPFVSPTPTRTATRTATPTTAANTSTPGPSSTTAATSTPTSAATSGPVATFAAAHDAHVKSSSPNSNYGTANNLRLRSGSPAYNSYLKFDVSGLSGTVQQVTLRLFAYDGGPDGGSVHAVSNNLQGTNTPWTETALKYNNVPAIGGSPLDSAGTVANNTWVELDVTSAVTGNGMFSFGITTGSTNSVYFNSSEASTNRPQLVIQTTSGTAAPTATTAPSATPTNTPNSSSTATNTAVLPTATRTNTAIATSTAIATATKTATPQATATTGATATSVPTATSAGATATSVPTATSTGGTQSFAAAHDSRVKSDSPTSNYGTSTYLRLRSSGTTYNSYLKFNVTGISGTVQQATLRLFTYDGGPDGGSIYAVGNNYDSTSTAWVDSGLTWNNAPTIGGSPLDSVGTVANNTWVEFDVTSAVNGNGTFSFGLATSSTNSVYFYSRESTSNPPELVIQTGPVLLGEPYGPAAPISPPAPGTTGVRGMSPGMNTMNRQQRPGRNDGGPR
jgi:CSLREA domain-containing protein